MPRLRVAVVYSKPSRRMLNTQYGETDEDSAVIAHHVERALNARGMDAQLLQIDEDNIDSILDIKADCIFNLVEWCGLDIELSENAFTYFRKLNIPITGSDEKMFVLTGDKVKVKKELKRMRAPTPQESVFVIGTEDINKSLKYPVIVKPSLEHCSTGLTADSIVYEEDKLREVVKRQIKAFAQPVIAEEFIVGRELLVYLLEFEGKVKLLPITEMIFKSDNPLAFQTYEAKWVEGHPDYNTTYCVDAKLSEEEYKKIEELCIKVFKKMGLRGYARFDLRLREGVPYILETNANPSVFDADHELKDINEEVITGIKFPDYIKAIVDSAISYHKQGYVI